MTTRAIIYGSDDNRQVVRAVRQGEVCSVPTNAWIDWQRQRGRERGGRGRQRRKKLIALFITFFSLSHWKYLGIVVIINNLQQLYKSFLFWMDVASPSQAHNDVLCNRPNYCLLEAAIVNSRKWRHCWQQNWKNLRISPTIALVCTLLCMLLTRNKNTITMMMVTIGDKTRQWCIRPITRDHNIKSHKSCGLSNSAIRPTYW